MVMCLCVCFWQTRRESREYCSDNDCVIIIYAFGSSELFTVVKWKAEPGEVLFIEEVTHISFGYTSQCTVTRNHNAN